MKENSVKFLGLSEENSNYDKAKVAVVSVPYEATVSYMGGTGRGPAAIIEASTQVEHYDEILEDEAFTIGVATLAPLSVDGVAPENVHTVIKPAISQLLADNKWPLVLGGEHSITPPVVSAFKDKFDDLCVVQFDAHADLRDSYEGSKMSHACAMARVREICPAVQIGIRNLCRVEAELAKKEKYPIIFAHEMQNDDTWMRRAIDAIDSLNVYITFDVDAFDGLYFPATGTPEPGGMRWYETIKFLEMLFEHKNVVGMDIVELAPSPGFHACDFTLAKLAYKCIGFLKRRQNG